MRWAGTALIAAAACASGLSAQELDAGQLQLTEGGERLGVERFRIWRAGTTVNAVATVELSGGSEWQVGVQLSAELLPLKYELQGQGAPRVSGERFSDRVRFHSIDESGERWKEFPSREVQALLEDGVAHHHLVLVRVLRQANGGRATVVVPSRGEIVAARLVGEGEDRVSIGERSVSATRYDLEIGGAPRSVWLDADDRLLRVRDTASRREAIRLPAR
ncbi:MAG: hypothetical protein R3266_09155 [Gemmatimonadota bacterium]|nr:hypothetical protein [Gemmatimonadota bacterium]